MKSVAADNLDALIWHALNRRPDAVAIEHGGVRLTYSQLCALITDIEKRLAELGIPRASLVAVEAFRSWRLVAAVIALVALGHSVAIIDSSLTQARQDDLRESIAPQAMLRWPDGKPWDVQRSPGNGKPPDPGVAYIAFTSGSTGKPKAAAIARDALAVFMNWHCRTYGESSGWIAAQIAAAFFDAFFWDVFGTLAGSAQLRIVDEVDLDPFSLWRMLAGVDVAFVPTALVHMLLAEEDMQPDEMRLRYLLTGGERLLARPSLKKTWQLVDHYGPAECTVLVTSTVGLGSTELLESGIVGHPIDGTLITIVDEDLRRVPNGQVGEILISGAAVGRGYVNDNAATKKAFVKGLPFLPEFATAYRTGDLGCIRGPEGVLAFHGRVDELHKIHGYGVTTRDVEAQLATHPAVSDAVAAVVSRQFGDCVVAAVTLRTPGIREEDLRTFYAERMPSHMIPSSIRVMPEFPRTSSGKLDRASIRKQLCIG